MQQAISTTFYRIKKEEEENRRNKKEITTKFDEEPVKSLVIIPGVISMVFMVVQVGTVFLCHSCCKELVNEICG